VKTAFKTKSKSNSSKDWDHHKSIHTIHLKYHLITNSGQLNSIVRLINFILNTNILYRCKWKSKLGGFQLKE
jgi:hypothetical protein